MIFIFADSDAANKARIAAQQMMAEIEREMTLAAFQQKLEDERAAAAASTAAYQSKLAREVEMAARMAELMVEKEIAELNEEEGFQAQFAEAYRKQQDEARTMDAERVALARGLQELNPGATTVELGGPQAQQVYDPEAERATRYHYHYRVHPFLYCQVNRLWPPRLAWIRN